MPSKVPRGKVGLYVLISGGTYAKLRKLIEEKYGGFPWGALSREVENAIELYIASQYQQSADRAAPGGERERNLRIKRVSRTLRTLAAIVKRILDVSEEEIPSNVVENIIMTIAGGDRKTINKYLKMLIDYKIVTSLSVLDNGATLYSVNKDNAEAFLSQF
ncbi:MAG: hypothetical protein QXV81_08215 [Ignisphaera sp.]